MERRLAERNCVCRFCHKSLQKGVDEAVFHYSHMNRGMNIIICKDCCVQLSIVWDEEKDHG
uniref:Uncharacterized protein n=1 Tax=Vibrio phage P018-4 TaxID=3229728 RepID=A0AB39AJI9_9CAUD